MEPQVEISMITMVGTILSTLIAGAVAYFVAKLKTQTADIEERVATIQVKVDGQLTETIALKQAVAFGKGEDRQRDKQDMKDAVAAGIKQANGPEKT
jgi:hypothetical protein